VTFFHENTNSLPANRFHLRSSAPVVIGGYWGGVTFQYYGGTLLGWLQVSPFQNGIGG
jgi:hypothetical protein